MATEQPTAGDNSGRRLALGVALALLVHLGFWWAARHAPPRPVHKKPEQVSVQIIDAPPPEPQPAPPAPEPVPEQAPPPKPPPSRVSKRTVRDERPLATPVPAPKDVPRDEPPTEQPVAEAAHPDPQRPGAASPAPPGNPVDPGRVRLFDPNAIGRSIARSGGQPTSQDDDARGLGGDGSGDGPKAEQARVQSRLGGMLAAAAQAGAVGGGIISSCDDGIDNDVDGAPDCASPGCREMPICRGTQEYANREALVIPDGSRKGIESAIDVDQDGPVRKVSVQVRLAHGSPGDLAIELVAPSGARAVLHRPDPKEGPFNRGFYVGEFTGQSAEGRWTLIIRDMREGVSGALNAWRLWVTSGERPHI